jgi:hypothetical protein
METQTRTTIMADISEQEEFEFRARAEAEQKAAEERARADREQAHADELKAAAEAHPVSPEGVEYGAKRAGDWLMETGLPYAYGAGKAITDVGGAALSNPVVQTGLELAGGGLAAKKFLVNPVIEALKPVGQAVGERVNNVTDALNRQAAASEAYSKGVAERAAARAGGVKVPTGPTVTYNVPTAKVPNVTGPAIPRATMVAEAAPRVAAVAPEAIENIPQQIQRFAAQKVLGPLAEGAQTVLNHPLINNPVTRFIASKPVQGAVLAMHSSDLGPPVPTRGVYKGMEINPNTGRPWTREELAAINGK